MKYTEQKNKYVFCKDGAYYALTLKQVNEINELSTEIILSTAKGNKLWHKVQLMWKILTNHS